MSQTETLLLVVLGFALAALIALFFGRMVWATALRLGARRMQKQVPSTLVDLQTERDRLRAEFAMLSQRLETRLESSRLRMAEQMAEVSRHRNRLEIAETALATKTAEIGPLAARVNELEATVAAQTRTHTELERSLAERDADLAAAKLRIGELIHGKPSAPVRATSEERLRERISRLTQMAQTVAQDRNGITGEPPADDIDPELAEKLSKAERETEDIQKELEKLDAEWSKRLNELEGTKPARTRSAKPRAVANVISLANRIRALQKDISGR